MEPDDRSPGRDALATVAAVASLPLTLGRAALDAGTRAVREAARLLVTLLPADPAPPPERPTRHDARRVRASAKAAGDAARASGLLKPRKR